MSEARPRLPAACTLLSYDRVDSTNDEAKRLARDGAREWTVVWAHEQTAGRGRRGRQWSSIPGNLYVYGAKIPAIVDETTPIDPISRSWSATRSSQRFCEA